MLSKRRFHIMKNPNRAILVKNVCK